MRIVRGTAPARAALAGNPSDAFGGATVALAVDDFAAEVVVYEWPELEILPAPEDRMRFAGIADLVDHVGRCGYHGGLRLVTAAVARFARWCQDQDIALEQSTFSVRYRSDVPRQVGLAGSSAIVVASLRALCTFHGVTIAPGPLASLALAVETEELGLAAGLQDRVAQTHGGLLLMDFAPELLAAGGVGRYEPLDHELLPPLLLAWRTDAAEESTIPHSDLRGRIAAGEPHALDTMLRLRELAFRARTALERRDHDGLQDVVNENFDLRAALMTLDPRHVAMVQTARAHGAAAHYCGSGGAILAVHDGDPERVAALRSALAADGCASCAPRVAATADACSRDTGFSP